MECGRTAERTVIIMKKRKYIAYGSNLNVEQMSFRCPDATVYATGTIENYRLAFTHAGGSGSYLTIEKSAGDSVPVVVWEVSERDEKSLDRYEGFPTFYRKEVIPVLIDGETDTECFAYLMNAREYGIPTSFYVNTCAQGYRAFGFDTSALKNALELSYDNVILN